MMPFLTIKYYYIYYVWQRMSVYILYSYLYNLFTLVYALYTTQNTGLFSTSTISCIQGYYIPCMRRSIMVLGSGVLMLLFIGLASGVVSGLFGIGGGVIIVPALVYLAGFSQHLAIGTSLAILLPPVGLAAVIEYYRHGNVDLKVALIVAAGLFTGAWLSAYFANKVSGAYLRLAFGVFVVLLGIYIIYGGVKRLPMV
jgi:hypothetical protein